ncbi:MAG: hypothetical protein IE931_07530 [Sphingobacteriales bacterium]|nr:hypothetical protein [Sphingobacteriales bacterium]
MKAYIFLTVFLLSASHVQAQNKAWQNVLGSVDKVSETLLKELKNATIFKSDDKRIIVSVNGSKPFTSYKSGEKHDKVVFLVNGEKVYAPAKIEYNEYYNIKDGKKQYVTNKIIIYPKDDIRYLENNQIYALKKDIDKKEPYKLTSDATIYNKDGSLKYGIKHQKDIWVIDLYSNKNTPILSFSTDRHWVNEHTNVLNCWTFNKPNAIGELGKIINKTSKGIYTGNAHAGTFQSNTNEIYTGYFAPISGISQGTVLFRERNGKGEWVLIVGDAIEETLPALISQKPNVSQLQQQIQVTPYTGNKIYKSGKETLNLFNSANDYLGNYSSNPTDGYGVKYQTTGDPTPAKEILMEVGIFEQGKLNGLGYRVKGDAEMRFLKDKPYGLQHKLTVEAGIFSGGVLAKGRTFILDKVEELNSFWHRNYWAKSPIKGFNFIQTNAIPIDTLQFYEKVRYADVKSEGLAQVFVEKLNRWVNIIGLDNNQNLLVKGDDGSAVTLDQSAGNVYFQSTKRKPIEVRCSKTKVVKRYKAVKEDVYWKDSQGRTLITDIDRSGYLKPIKVYTSNKQVLDGYETVTCTICNGAGYYQSYTTEKIMYRLDLTPNNLYSKVSDALKKSFDTTDAENTLFGSSDHLQFEADSYLNLFNNDATRTYDHLKEYNKNLQYQWIKTAKNAREIYTAFADLFYLIYQKNPNASYYFLTTIHANSYKESLAIVTSKYPEARAYISKKAKEILNKK